MKKKSTFALMFAVLLGCGQVFADGIDVTDRIKNGDCESLEGWDITFTTMDNKTGYIWKTSNHSETGADLSYYGFAGRCFEIWGSRNLVGANSITQVVRGLDNGTYVFGAFTAACIQGEYSTQEPNVGEVEGVYMIAGDNKIPVATNDPQAEDMEWGHTWKYNIAATVTDGSLRIGLVGDETCSATYITFDSPTLYYFGDMSEEDALLAMRKIDLQTVITACNTLKQYPMAADILATMNNCIEAAEEATTLAEAEKAEEALRQAKLYATNSALDYDKLTQRLNEAREVAQGEWSDDVASYVENLKELIAQVEEEYYAGSLDKDAVNVYCADLQDAIDLVKLDELWVLLDELQLFVNRPEDVSEEEPSRFVGTSHPGFGDEIGQFPESQFEILCNLIEEVEGVLGSIDSGDKPASEGVKYIDKIIKAVENCIALQNKGNSLPLTLITIPDKDGSAFYIESTNGPTTIDYDTPLAKLGITPVESLCEVGQQVFRYESPVIQLDKHIDRVRMSVVTTLFTQPNNKLYPYGRAHNSCNCGPYFNINEMYFYDGTGEQFYVTEDMLNVNAQQGNEGPLSGLVDGIIDGTGATFFHSCYSSGTHPASGNHYIELIVPDGLTEFSFAFEVVWDNKYRLANIPVTINLEAISTVRSDLDQILVEADKYNPIYGTDPGFYSTDCSAFFAARDAAKAISKDENATAEEIIAAGDALAELIPLAEEATLILPEPGVEYCITSAAPFFAKQQVVKNMTVRTYELEDTTLNTLCWDTADPTDKNQFFTFEVRGDYEGGYAPIVIKNVGTGEYVGNFIGGYPGLSNQGFSFGEAVESEDADVLRLVSLGSGQFNIMAYGGTGARYTGWMGLHCGDHNEGAYSTNAGNYGHSIYGQYGAIVQYNTGMDGPSAWFIRRMNSLPFSEDVEGETIQTRPFHFFSGVNNFTIQADKPCAFTNLRLYDILGNEITYTATSNAYAVTLTLDAMAESFSIAFDNPEGVNKITLSGGVTKITRLIEAYEAEKANTYVEGTDVGCIKDLSAYNKAMANAEKLIENGCDSDEEIDAAIQAINDAKAAFETVKPEAGKSYLIVSAYAPFYANWGTEMGIYDDAYTGVLAWAFLCIDDSRYEWTFDPATTEDGQQGYYIRNVGTGRYIGNATSTSRADPVPTVGDATVIYSLVTRPDCTFNILNISSEGRTSGWMFHPGWHDDGTRPFASVCYYPNENPSKSEWRIREVASLRSSIEEMTEEPIVTTTVEGIFDLTGRRVAVPVSGLYIINGKKVLVK